MVVDTRPLRIPEFRRLWASTVVTAIGSQLTVVAVPLQVYAVTGSSGYVGLAGAFALAPLVVFGLWGGAIADTVDRRKLLLAANAGIAAASLLLWLQAAAGNRSVWPIFGLLMLQQACFGLSRPARQAAVPRLVPVGELPAAIALSSTVGTFGMVMGPMLAGALIPLLGLSTMYLTDAVGLVATLWAVWRLPALPPLGPLRGSAGLRGIADGFRYMAKRGVLLVSFLADIIAMVFGMPRALFPEMAEQTFGDPPGGGLALGLLYAAIPAGSLVAGLLSGLFSRSRRHGVGVVLAVCGWGVAIVGFGLAPWLWLAVVFLAVGGACDMVSMVMRSAILQTAATDEMRGRMQGTFTVVVSGGPRVADLLHGTVGAAAGTGLTVAGGGVLVVVATIALAVAVPVFWRYLAPAGTPEPVPAH